MILLLSTANELYWLGRYSERLNFYQQLNFSKDHDLLTTFVKNYAVNLPTSRQIVEQFIQSEVLPSIISSIESNVQNVRGVIDEDTFELYNLIKRLTESGSLRAATLQLHACNAAMDSQDKLVRLFWLIGRYIEQVDNCLRMQQNASSASRYLQELFAQLPKNTRWRELDRLANLFMQNQEKQSFMELHSQFDQLITEGV